MRPQVSQSAFAERHEKVLRTPRARPDCAARRRALRALGGDVWPASCTGSCLACNAPGMRGISKCGPAAGVDMSHLSFTRIGHACALSGALSSLRHPDDLILCYGAGRGLAAGTLMFGGTMPAIGGIRPADRFEMDLHDPVLGRILRHGYDIAVLPVIT